MPKPTSFAPPAGADEEKTTVESGWEEEASTTVEQGDVAEKIRSLAAEGARGPHHNTNITSTNGNSVVDEPTVEDGQANVILTPPNLNFARLLVTQGNDSGQQIEIVPGKSYTIGRAIDNDVVLTDIAVSRKHFDLRHEVGTWVLADRGSGNGTLVNGNLEDQPFVLANGDQIEIGNTTFRFEQANAPPRPRASAAGQYEIEDEEQSTVASKPIRTEGLPTPAQIAAAPRARPKTAPPPPLPRSRTASGHAAYSPPQQLAGLPGMPPMQARPSVTELLPRDSLMAPQLLPQPRAPLPVPVLPQSQIEQLVDVHRQPVQPLPASTLPLPQLAPSPNHGTPPLPTTIPGQGVRTVNAHMHGVGYAYPAVGDLHAQMVVASNGQGRDATTTALVQPTPYGIPLLEPLPPLTNAPFSRRTKLMLIGAGLTLLAAIATIAIIKGSESRGAIDDERGSDGATAGTTKATVTPIDPNASTATPVKPEPPKPEPAKATPVKPEPPKPEPQKTVAKPEPPKPEPAKATLVKPEPPKPEPQKTVAKPEPQKTVAKPEQKPERAKPEPKPEPHKTAQPKPAKPEPVKIAAEPPKQEPSKPKTSSPRADSSDVRKRALELYRGKQFSQAAKLLRDFASTTSGREASDLKTRATAYETMGRHYNNGSSPGAQAREAYTNLRAALTDDSNGPAAFTADITAKLAAIAPKAAMLFFIDKNYTTSLAAVKFAEGNGGSSESTRLVRSKLDARANELYREAAKSSDPDVIKQKVSEIRGMVDSASPIRAKADALLNEE